jgi:hypothetical protein
MDVKQACCLRKVANFPKVGNLTEGLICRNAAAYGILAANAARLVPGHGRLYARLRLDLTPNERIVMYARAICQIPPSRYNTEVQS